MREIKKYVRYYLEKRTAWKDQSKLRPRSVEMFFNYNGRRVHDNTGMKVAECDWDSKKQRVKVNVKRANEVNSYLDLLEDKLNNIYFASIAKGIIPDNNHILKEMKKDRKVEKPSLLDEWKKFLEVKKNNLRPGSIVAMRHSFEHFERFAQGKRIEFDDLNAELVSKYASYLFDLGHVDNTVHKHLKRMRAFMASSKKAGLHSNERYKDFNISEKSSRIVFLEWKEVKTLLDYKTESVEEQNVLDAFLWGCLTAMRYSDYQDLKKSEIIEVNFEGLSNVYHAAKYRQHKTDKIMVTPLLPESLDILERYKNDDSPFALPRAENAAMNLMIKQIGKKAGINGKMAVDKFKLGKRETTHHEKWELLSTHIGRKTFISVAASKGIPVHIVADIAGHSVKTCMKFYAGVADKERFVRVVNDMKFAPGKTEETNP